MPQFVKIGTRADLPQDGEAKEFTIGKKVICVANLNGRYSALDNVCVHRGGPLGQGIIMDDKLICPWHGWRFDLTTGVPLDDPSQCVAVYPIKIEGDDVLVEI